MAPRRSTLGDIQSFNTLGVKGRKTGVDLKDTGERDEHGLPPIEGVFSEDDEGDETQGEEDMDIDSVTATSVSAVRRPPRSAQSPQAARPSPPHQATNGQPAESSPPVPHNATSRQLFAKSNMTAGAKARATSSRAKTKGRGAAQREESEEDEDAISHPDGDAVAGDAADESVPSVNGHGPEERDGEEEVEADAEAEAPRPAKSKGRPPKSAAPGKPSKPSKPAAAAPPASTRATADSQAPKRRGRPGKDTTQEEEQQEEPELESVPEPESEPAPPSASKKRGRPSKKADAGAATHEAPEEEAESSRQTKRQKTAAPATRQTEAPVPPPSAPAAAKGKGRAPAPQQKPRGKGRPKKVAAAGGEVGDESIMTVQRGPPMPKGRGLISARPEGGIFQTRSGRHSFKPLQYWRGEKVLLDENNTVEDTFGKGRLMVLPGIKEVVRVEEEEPVYKKKSRPAAKRATATGSGKRSKHAAAAGDLELEEYEDWEIGPGTLSAPVLLWDRSHQTNPPGPEDEVDIVEDHIAVSGPGLEPREIRDANFRFVKTLTLPFLGTGIVDLPVGTEKKSKNSRRMHMVFFVFTGKVAVTVHDFEFRISAGGTFFVPRGNYYSLKNDYDQPVRLFFAQGCEVEQDPNDTVVP